jgi:hypothetical protein
LLGAVLLTNFERMYNLPVDYTKLHYTERKVVRLQYIEEQKGLCHYCGRSLNEEAPQHIKDKKINWKLFPQNFLQYPIHLQHNHDTGMTEGAVHNYCNAVMWQYEGR